MSDFLWALVGIGNSIAIGIVAYRVWKLERQVQKVPVVSYRDGG